MISNNRKDELAHAVSQVISGNFFRVATSVELIKVQGLAIHTLTYGLLRRSVYSVSLGSRQSVTASSFVSPCKYKIRTSAPHLSDTPYDTHYSRLPPISNQPSLSTPKRSLNSKVSLLVSL